jgi:myo-inositol 2-dehydrogenase / D-chiro-inositol 1-dehydrogenase
MSTNTLHGAWAQGSDEIRVGVIGCGGRGTGAARNVVDAAPGVRIVAIADAFKDRLDESRAVLAGKLGDRFAVTDDTCFVGLDAYKRVLEANVNYVILATPPAFRPAHLEAAVAAGKHIFAEKPVAVDGAGVRSCYASAEAMKQKGLGCVAGTIYRHHVGYLESIQRVHDGQIGEVTGAIGWYNTSGLWRKDRQPEWSELEYQLRNWIYYTWLSGDHIVEQAVHNVDALNWIMRGNPVKAVATGGRQVRTGPDWGHIYDHFAIDYEYPNGRHVSMFTRQQDNTDKKVANEVIGTTGRAFILPRFYITGEKPWTLETPQNDAYVTEHTHLIESIRAGKPLNELTQIADSTLAGIMGREAAYTGQVVTWADALAGPSLMPKSIDWGPMPQPAVPMPGITA